MNENQLDCLIDYAKEAYSTERDNAEKIRDRVELISGIFITPVGGILVYLFSTFPGSYSHCEDFWLFAVPASISALLVLAAICLVLWAFGRGYTYSYTPTPSSIFSYAEALNTYNAAVGIAENETLNDLKRNILNSLCVAIDHNSKINIKRSNYVLYAIRLLVIAVLMTAISTPRYVYRAATTEDEIQKIEVINAITLNQRSPKMTTESNSSQPGGGTGNQPSNSATPQSTPQQPSQASPAKPSYPQNRLITESSVPPVNTSLSKDGGK